MTGYVLYGIPNCDTVKKARKWFEEKGLSYRFHNFKKDGVDHALVASWLAALGPDKVINKRGTTWRKLEVHDQTRAENAPADLLVENPSLIKRPVISGPHGLSVGFGVAEQTMIEQG